jgi:MprA protease rhombosortase-interaction domain-containing protein
LKAHLAPDSDALTLDGLDRGSDVGLAICEPASPPSGGGGALPLASLALLLMAQLHRRLQRR